MKIKTAKVNCLVFENNSLQELLEEILAYLSEEDKYNLEKTMQDFVIIYDSDESAYIATIYAIPEL